MGRSSACPGRGSASGKLGAEAPGYLWPNLVGSAGLAVLAGISGQWGVLLLEAAWAVL
jgi:hypothetical protein